MITKESEGTYDCDMDGCKFRVLCNFPKMIFLSGDCGVQSFANSLEYPPERLWRYFKDKEAIARAAQLHTEGEVDKQKFMAEISRFVREKRHGLTENDKTYFHKFIHSSQLNPEQVRMQLIARGYERLNGLFEFSKPKTELLATCAAMEYFVNGLKIKS